MSIRFPDGWIPVPCEGGFLSEDGKVTRLRGQVVPEDVTPGREFAPSPEEARTIAREVENATGVWLVPGDFSYDEKLRAYTAPVTLHAKQPTHKIELVIDPETHTVADTTFVTLVGESAYDRNGIDTQRAVMRLDGGELKSIDPVPAGVTLHVTKA
jgi:hypothetical protein